MKKLIILAAICILSHSGLIAQDHKATLEFVNGISLPSGNFGNFAENGFNNEISFSKSCCDPISLVFGAKHSSFNFRQDFGQVQSGRKQFRSLALDMGPQFQIGSDQLSVSVYGRTGILLNSSPEIIQYYPKTDIMTTNLSKQSKMALSTRIGAKISTRICNGIQLFLSGEYFTGINGNLNYDQKDLSKAINPEGRIDADLVADLPSSTSELKISGVNLNFGVQITIGSCSNRKSNPLYQNNQMEGEMPLYDSRYNSGQKTTLGTRAQDYNNSRSNRGTIIDKGNNNSGKPRGVQAQDYNSSRSNNSSVVNPNSSNGANNRTVTNTGEETSGSSAQNYNNSRSNRGTLIDNGDNNSGNSGSKAQDYNSSISNTTSAVENDESDKKVGNLLYQDKNNKGENPLYNEKSANSGNQSSGTRAQDYNNSRSNRGTLIDNGNNNSGNGGSKAQDYNSSRSNTTSAIENDESDKKVGNPLYQDKNNKGENPLYYEKSANSGNQSSGTRAQDYNNSRSNRTVTNTGDQTSGGSDNTSRTNYHGNKEDIEHSMDAAEKRKMKRKLRKEERQKRKEEKQAQKLKANSVY